MSIKGIKQRSNVFRLTRDAAISWEGSEKEGVLESYPSASSPNKTFLASGTQAELLKLEIETSTICAPIIPAHYTQAEVHAHFKVKGTDAKFRVEYTPCCGLDLAKDFEKAYALYLEQLEKTEHLQPVPSKQRRDNH